MKRRAVEIVVSDHAVLRWLERAHGLDVEGIRAMLTGKVLTGAELDAIAVVTGGVRLVLRDHFDNVPGGPVRVVVTTALQRGQMRGLHGDGGGHD